jgi:hypothetical protein
MPFALTLGRKCLLGRSAFYSSERTISRYFLPHTVGVSLG